MKGWKLYLEIDGLMLDRWACRWRVSIGQGLDIVTADEMYGRPDFIRLPAGDYAYGRGRHMKIGSVIWNPGGKEVILQAANWIEIDDAGELRPVDRALLEDSPFELVAVRGTDPTEAGQQEAAQLAALPGHKDDVEIAPPLPVGLCASCTRRFDCNLRMDGVVSCPTFRNS